MFRRRTVAVITTVSALISMLSLGSPASASGIEGGVFVAVAPARIADSTNGVNTTQQPMTSGSTRTIGVLGVGGVPSTGVGAVVVDIAGSSTAGSALHAYPSDGARQGSILKMVAGSGWNSNTAVVQPGADGKITLYNSAGSTNFNVDVQGYFTDTSDGTAPGGFVAIDPERAVSTGAGTGVAQAGSLKGGTTTTIDIASSSQIPADAAAVFANVRFYQSTYDGGAKIVPSDSTTTSAYSVNFLEGRFNDTGMSIKLGPDGKIKVSLTGSSSKSTHLIVDIQGYFSAGGEEGSVFVPLDNSRIFDSRDSVAVPANGEAQVEMAGKAGIPSDGSASAAMVTVMAMNWTNTGSIRLYNPDAAAPNTTNLAFTAPFDRDVSSTSIVEISNSGHITIQNLSSGPVHVILDAQGWFGWAAEDSQDEGAASCQISVAATSATGVDVESASDSSVLALIDDSDPAVSTFEGTLDGETVDVRVLMGASQSDIEGQLADSEQDLDDLAAESVEEAVDGELTTAEEPTPLLASASTTEPLQPVAYELSVAGSTEIGSFDSSDCKRVDSESTEEVVVGSGSGLVTVPGPGATSAAARTYPSTTSVVRYRTFIPAAKATTYQVCGTFKGDNRGFTNYYAAPNRTRASVFFNWHNQTMEASKSVSPTHRLAAYGKSAATKTASTKGIRFRSAVMWPAYGRVEISHAVGNPLCGVAGDIRYNVVVEAWKSGAARISGKRGKVPSHEAYLYPTSGTRGKKIFTRKSSSFICLSLNCGDESLWETT